MTMLDVTAPKPLSAAPAVAPAPDPAEIAVRLAGVSKIYRLYGSPKEQVLDSLGLWRWIGRKRPQFQEFHALRDVNLTVLRGQRVGIIGRNGAGKTTLLKLITGNFAPTHGAIDVNGSVQALMQTGLGFHPEFSGYENIKAALNYNGLVGEDFEAALADVVDFVELGDFLHQPMKTYSLGMNARVQFATATAIKPDIVIIDEVLGAGDAYFAAKSSVRMRRLTGGHSTLLLVSHSMPQVLQFCSRAIWIEDGRVKMDGPAPEVAGAYEVASERRINAVASPETAPVPDKNVSDFRHRDWISNEIARKEQIAPTDTARSTELLTEHQVELDNGLKVFRWPGKPGLKYRNLTLHDEHGRETYALVSQKPARIQVRVELETEIVLVCRFFFSVFNLEALRLCWITSPRLELDPSAGTVQDLEVSLDPLLLGGGTFILSASVFGDVDLMRISADQRYDLLARCLEFKVLEQDGREYPVFHQPAAWHISVQGGDR